MNRIYRLVWNHALRTLQIASEFAHDVRDGTTARDDTTMQRLSLTLVHLAALAMSGFALPAWSTTCTPDATHICGVSGTRGFWGLASGMGGPGGQGSNTQATDGSVNDGGAGRTVFSVADIGLPGAPGQGRGGSGAGGSLANYGVGAGGAGGFGGYTCRLSADNGMYCWKSGGGGGGGGGGIGTTIHENQTNDISIYGGNGGQGGAGNYVAGSGQGGGGGAAVWFTTGSSLTNGSHGVLHGGDGGSGYFNPGFSIGGAGDGGTGASGSGFQLFNDGKIMGGAGGTGGSLNIQQGYAKLMGGHGGNGINGNDFTLHNNGSIVGGAGGTAVGFHTYASTTRRIGGAGGNGISGSAFSLLNTGRITGGAGGAGDSAGGMGGIGILAQGDSHITTRGHIAGGLSGDGATRADAVHFSGGGNTLILESGFSFIGNVVSDSGSTGGGDTLGLGGDSNDTFDVSAIGNQYRGFTSYTKTGTSTWTLTGTTSAATPWTIEAGTLSVSSGANLGDAADTLTFDGGTLENTMAMSSGRDVTLNSGGGTFQTDANLTLSGTIGGNGRLTKTGTGTLILTAANTYTGSTTITAGTLQIGDGSGGGSLAGDITNNGTLTFDTASATTFQGSISGHGSIAQTVPNNSTLILEGDSSAFTGTTTVQSNILIIGEHVGSKAVLGGDVIVGGPGILGGYGTIGGNVTAEGGSMISLGNEFGTLTINGDFTAQKGSLIALGFDKPAASPDTFTSFGQSDSIHVGGGLTLEGAQLAVKNTPNLGPGLYNVFTYGGTLTTSNGGITLRSMPQGTQLVLQTLTAQRQINLIDITGVALGVWNANGKADATRMGGGDGTWSNTTKVWTDATGTVPDQAMQPQPGFALFGGDKGAVTVDDSADPVQATGMQFAVDGYTLTGDTLALVKDANGNTPVIRVGNGSAASSGMSATIANVLAGTSGFIKTDLGTLILSAANTYTGSTTVNGGTLEIAADGTPGNGAVIVDGHAVLGAPDKDVILQVDSGAAIANHIELDRGALLDNAGTITGNTKHSSVVESASGTATVHNHDGGAIAGAATGVALSAGGEVDNGAASTISGTTAVSIAGGPGTLRNAGTMTGNVMLDSGYANTVELTAGGAIRGNLSIGDDAASVLVLDGDNTTAQSYAKAVLGTTTFAGTLTKTGSGTWIIDNDALAGVTGVTTVKAGALIVGDDDSPNVSLDGAVTVAKGALLGGFGTVGGIDLSGTLATGHSLGTLHAAGDVTFRKGSSWQVEVDPNGSSDRLDVTGKAVIQGGDVTMLTQADTISLGTDYTILQAQGGIQGQFDSVDTKFKLTFLKPVLTYLTHTVTLSLERNDTSFASVARTRNQKNTAGGIESLGWGNPVYDTIATMNANQARDAFDQISGEWYANALTARLHDSRYVREAMNQRLTRTEAGHAEANAARLGHTAGTIWFHAWGQWGDHDGDGNAARMRFHGSGLLVGVDADLDRVRIGGVLGASRISIRDDQRASNGHDKATWLGLYGSAVTGPVHWRGGLAYARDHIDSNRRIAVPGLAGSVGADPDGHTGQAWIEAALPFASTHGHAAPFLNLAHVRVSTDGWHEGGSSVALQGSGSDAKATLATLGIRSVWTLADTEHPIRFHGRIGWRQAFGADTPQVTLHLDGSAPFVVYGLPLAQHAIVMQAGLDFAVSRNVRFNVGYSGQFASHMLDQGGRMSLKIGF